MFRSLGCKEPREHVQRPEPSIAGSNAVVPIVLQELEKLQDAFCGEILDAQLLDPATTVTRRKLQHQDHSVTITAYGVHTHAPLLWKILLEEARDADAQIGGTGALHEAPPVIIAAYARANRSLACMTT